MSCPLLDVLGRPGRPYPSGPMIPAMDTPSWEGMENRYGRDDGITFHSFRHTFATRCAAAGVPLRTLQEWLGHRDYKTVLIYADYQPDDRREAALVERAFEAGINSGINLSETERTSADEKGSAKRDTDPADPGLSNS